MIEKSHAKVNIFLKMVGTRGNYHELLSRFMRVDNLYDTITFIPQKESSKAFALEGDFGCKKEQNTIYKAYQGLLKMDKSGKVEKFFQEYSVHVDKKIPEFAGLGGGSSNAAAFLRLTNRILKLDFKPADLAKIGATIGADVPFFIYNYPSANVSGIGEKVEQFEEEPLLLETFTPDIRCDTAKVYRQFRQKYLANIHSQEAYSLLEKESKTLLETKDATFLNDLFAPAVDCYPTLKAYHDKEHFFSGSGSTFFRIKHG